MVNRDGLLARKDSNKQQAKERASLIDNLKSSKPKFEQELDQLEAKKIELEQELAKVNGAISLKTNNLAQLREVISQKKKEGKSIKNGLAEILGTAEEDQKVIAEVDSIRLDAMKAIKDFLGL